MLLYRRLSDVFKLFNKVLGKVVVGSLKVAEVARPGQWGIGTAKYRLGATPVFTVYFIEQGF